MRPDLILFLAPYLGETLSRILVPTYVELLLGGLLLSSWLILRRLDKSPELQIKYLAALTVGYFGLFAGGHVGWVFFNFKEYIQDSSKLFRPWEAGLSTIGAITGSSTAVWAYFRGNWLAFLDFSDTMAPGAGLGLAFAKLGCLMNGCCFGKITNHFWGVTYPIGRPAWNEHYLAGKLTGSLARSLPTYPVQSLEILIGLFLFILLTAIESKRIPLGFLYRNFRYYLWYQSL